MRSLSLLLLLSFFGFSFVLPACAQRMSTQKVKAGKKTAAAPKAATPTAAGPVLTFERTPCYGTCPGYSMQVYADGRVAYEGRRAVPLMGKQELKLPAAAVADMLRQAKEVHFETFDKQYSRNTSDLPGTIVAIRQPDGTLKSVTVEEGAPENVRSFFTYLGNQFDQLAQLNGVEK
ncbi:hypothetical protein ACVWYF_001768 [Hymenobacter sp. UYAg731]